MIESEEKRQRLLEMVSRWCEHTKVLPYLRDGDIPNLVRQVLGEFYNVTLCCGHLVKGSEGVHITFRDYIVDRGDTEHGGGMGEVSGTYCKDCAEKLKKDLGAWEVK